MAESNPPDPDRDEPPTLPGPSAAGAEPFPTQPYLPAQDPVPTPTWEPVDDAGRDPSPTATLDPIDYPRPGFRPARLPGYDLLNVVGMGGLAAVYRARHRELGLEVAVKVLFGQYSRLAQDASAQAVLQRLGRLRHPNLVATYGHGRYEDYPFLVMEYVEGQSLYRVFDGGPRPDFRETARLLEGVARGVEYLHGEGILHRDIKPGNILVDAAGRPRLTDYGLAMLWPEDFDFDPETPAPIVGTPAFMSPEQAMGNAQAFGPALDVWALGSTLFWMLTGQQLFRRNQVMETLMALLHEEVPSPRSVRPDVPADLEAICLRCLRRPADKRYPSAAALADDLRRFQGGEPIEEAPRRKRRPWWAFWRKD